MLVMSEVKQGVRTVTGIVALGAVAAAGIVLFGQRDALISHAAAAENVLRSGSSSSLSTLDGQCTLKQETNTKEQIYFVGCGGFF